MSTADVSHSGRNLGPLWAAVGIAALVAVNFAFDAASGRSFGDGSFLHLAFRNGVLSGPLVDILHLASRVIILAIGMSIVISLRGVDLSVGSVMAISGAIAASMISAGYSPWICVVAALAASLAAGLWNATLIIGLRLQPFVATLVLLVAGRGLAQLITKGQVVTFHSPTIEFLSDGKLILPFPFLLAVAWTLATMAAMRWTALGLLLRAVGGNPVASELSGVRARLLTGAAYVFCSLCAGMAGLIDAANIKAADPHHAGINAELAAIFAAIVGGTSISGGRFTLAGALLGGLLMQALIATMYARDVSPDVAPLPQATVILLVCLVASPQLRAMMRRAASRRISTRGAA